MQIQTGEIFGKQTAAKFVMYNVIKVTKPKGLMGEIVTLQNIDNPLSLFETTAQKLAISGYVRISQTPYVNLQATSNNRRKNQKKQLVKANRCPLTVDFLEHRADSQKPAPIMPDLFED